ncbi:hypothetical protein P886_2509 [Alteromonadaceae bacterium 2753L.S.0a.02]|nr:hypothetical protein P886_2509 [Alteromonadaceae bacterium 2753L.S.0a.02]
MKKLALASAVSMAVLLSACSGDDGKDGAQGAQGPQGPQGDTGAQGPQGQPGVGVPPAKLVRLVTTPLGSEVTGMYKTDNGEFFFNIQHPDTSLPGDEGKAAVGAWVGVDVDNLDPYMTGVAVPASDSAEAQTTVVAGGSYQVLGREGDTFTSTLPYGLGAIVNGAGDALIKQSENPDFNAYLPTSADGSTGLLFTAWEDRPGAMSRIELTLEEDGTWTTGSALNIDFSGVAGTMINCFGTLSPWGTPLTSEENYEAENTKEWNNTAYSGGYPNYADVQNIQTYLGGTYPNPYDYGYIVEITNPKETSPAPVKLFAMGRYAHENPVVMPDHKTVYLTDDGTNKGFYKFVADTAGDLTAGTLYAAKLTQDATSNTEKAGFNVSWIELAHGTNTEIEAWINTYDGIDETDFVDGSNSYITDAEVATWAAGGAADNRVAFLETLKAAGAKGATVEFRKMEGVNINYAGVASGAVPYMYVAMSEVAKGMSDDEGDIQVEENKCGAVYRFGLDASYNTTRMEPVVVGGPYDGDAAENRCALDNISNPDNIVVLDDGRVIIGEDTGNHVNNMIWVYNPAGK